MARVERRDDTVDAALAASRRHGLYIILRIQDLVERRLVVVDGGVERQRTTRLAGCGVQALTPDGSLGFASIDDIQPGAVRAAVASAGAQAEAARVVGAERSRAVFEIARGGVVRLDGPQGPGSMMALGEQVRRLVEAQESLGSVDLGQGLTIRTSLLEVEETWRIVRSDGADVSFATPRASLRHELSGRVDGKIARATATVSGALAAVLLSDEMRTRLTRRTRRAAADARLATTAPTVPSGSYRVVLGAALAKGLAHEAIGHLCETDVDASALMRGGRLRIGERLARAAISVIDGPLPGDYAQQPFSANGIARQSVRLIDAGVLRNGLGDLFSAARAGAPNTGACRSASFRDRPTPRMTNIRIELSDAAPLALDPDDLAPEDVAAALDGLGLLDRGRPTIYLAGYRGGVAHPRRGDFTFGASAAFDLGAGARPYAPSSFSGLAERALAAILAGVGPLCTDAIGTCRKDGSGVSSSGGSHALLVLDADPDLIVSAAS